VIGAGSRLSTVDELARQLQGCAVMWCAAAIDSEHSISARIADLARPNHEIMGPAGGRCRRRRSSANKNASVKTRSGFAVLLAAGLVLTWKLGLSLSPRT
jgi:hypothetical protein